MSVRPVVIAALKSVVRMALILIAVFLLRFLVVWLKPYLYPDGLNGELSVLGIGALLASTIILVVRWAPKPLFQVLKASLETWKNQNKAGS